MEPTHHVAAGAESHLSFSIEQQPDFAWLRVHLRAGEKVIAEPSAMATMTPTIAMKAGFRGGFGRTVGRLMGGESLIVNTFSAQSPGEVTFAPGTPGDMRHVHLKGNSLMLQRGAFVAHSGGIDLSGKWQGAKGFFSGEGLVLLRASGSGDVFFNSYGAILEVDVRDGFVVDTGYIVAFEDTLQYRVSILPGLKPGAKIKAFLFGGEGLVCQFSGQGRVWIQTRDVRPFLRWVNPYRRVKSSQ